MVLHTGNEGEGTAEGSIGALHRQSSCSRAMVWREWSYIPGHKPRPWSGEGVEAGTILIGPQILKQRRVNNHAADGGGHGVKGMKLKT